MNDEYLIERGYKQHPTTPFDHEHIVARFQKRFDDDYGKKYFINVLKWSNNYIPTSHRGSYWTPYSYEYETQVTMHEQEDALNFHFFTTWTLEDVEKFMEDFFVKMKPNYYENWDGERGIRP
jgi:hypothetical protein